MDNIETLETPLTSDSLTEKKSHSGAAVAIPVIVAGLAAAGAFLVRKFRKPADASTPLTESHPDIPTQD